MRTFQEHNYLSIVVPTLDAGDTLSAMAESLQSRAVGELIVVDGGSSDDTLARARQAGARLVIAERGRGTQLAAGAAAATCSWLLFVHADCRLDRGWEAAVDAFVTQPEATERAGYFVYALDDRSPAARRLERFVAWRCRMLALPYGDQGLLISRALYAAIGGFASIALMEDVDIVRRLGRSRIAAIDARCIASARRYRRDGYRRRMLRNLLCLTLWQVGVAPQRIASLYR